ncbi:N-acetyltransferase family protein [Dactylosporangium sp. CA-092794]|uniref:GNAT family N-acetyltransferase n=1 Tax=Dactylosporangium sp. CA-092794 TaxID=3239929 RepID=UPI003D90F945
MDQTRVYRATAGDLAALLPLVREFCAVDRHEFDEERVTRALRPLLAGDAHGQVWLVGGAASGPVGYAVVTWGWSLESGGREALLDEIYVRDRGNGLGGALLRRTISAATEAGAAAMFLETEAHNDRVRTFYARHGFEAEDSVWMSRPTAAGAGLHAEPGGSYSGA